MIGWRQLVLGVRSLPWSVGGGEEARAGRIPMSSGVTGGSEERACKVTATRGGAEHGDPVVSGW